MEELTENTMSAVEEPELFEETEDGRFIDRSCCLLRIEACLALRVERTQRLGSFPDPTPEQTFEEMKYGPTSEYNLTATIIDPEPTLSVIWSHADAAQYSFETGSTASIAASRVYKWDKMADLPAGFTVGASGGDTSYPAWLEADPYRNLGPPEIRLPRSHFGIAIPHDEWDVLVQEVMHTNLKFVALSGVVELKKMGDLYFSGEAFYLDRHY